MPLSQSSRSVKSFKSGKSKKSSKSKASSNLDRKSNLNPELEDHDISEADLDVLLNHHV